MHRKRRNKNEDREYVWKKSEKQKEAARQKKSKLKKALEKETKEINAYRGKGMRPAEDVYKRIRWDPILNLNDFSIGYTDFNIDEQEKVVTEVEYPDFPIEDVPMHVIRYFKYKGNFVWQREEKVDNFFGSVTRTQFTSGVKRSTIEDLMAKINKNSAERHPSSSSFDDNDSDSLMADNEMDATEIEVREENVHLSHSQEEHKDGKSMEVDVYLRKLESALSLHYAAKSYTEAFKLQSEVNAARTHLFNIKHGLVSDYKMNEELLNISKITTSEKILSSPPHDKKKHKNKHKHRTKHHKKKGEHKHRPTHFVSFRITDQIVVEKLRTVQDTISARTPSLSPLLIPPETFHITLALFHIDEKNEEINELERAKNTFESFLPKFENLLCPEENSNENGEDERRGDEEERKFEIRNLCTFGRGRVLFAELYDMKGEKPKLLKQISDELYSHFEGSGVSIDHQTNDLKVHLTVMKWSRFHQLSKDQKHSAKLEKLRSIPKSSYVDYEKEHFGFQSISEIDLCSMRAEKQIDGYYSVVQNLKIEGV